MSGGLHVLATERPDRPGWVRLGEVVDRDQADVALFPFDLASCLVCADDVTRLRSIVASNASVGLRTVLAITHDTTQALSLGQPDAIVIRTSMLGTQPYPGEYPGAVTVSDPLDGGDCEVNAWRERAMVGFMGFAEADATHRVVRAAAAGEPTPQGYVVATDPHAVRGGHVAAPMPAGPPPVLRQPINIGIHVRRRALSVLASSTKVDTSFVIRDRYFGHFSSDEMATLRQDYIRHLFGSDYVLCVRGAGNYSIRLFETMAAGRIPVIVDTDLVLPCADVVDWEGLAVWVPLADLDRIDELIAREHAAMGPEGFAARQRAVRAAWVQSLSPAGFSAYVASRVRTTWERGEGGE